MSLSDNDIQLFKSTIEKDFLGLQLIISDDQKEKFWQWFKEKANWYYAVPSDELVDTEFEGNCFDIAQKISQEKNMDYLEGFVLTTLDPTYHGFNLSDNKVKDYTARKHQEDYKFMNSGQLPTEYCGIKIPDELIKAENSNHIEKNSINLRPLLYKLFLKECIQET
jgi:hypothetical protein